MIRRGPYTVQDLAFNLGYEGYTEDEVRELAKELGIGRYNNVDEISIESVISLIESGGAFKIIYKGEVNMGSKKGKQAEAKEKLMNDLNEVELLFFQLIEWSFDELLDLYNDYKELFRVFGDREYKYNTMLVMEAMQTKILQKEVNVP